MPRAGEGRGKGAVRNQIPNLTSKIPPLAHFKTSPFGSYELSVVRGDFTPLTTDNGPLTNPLAHLLTKHATTRFGGRRIGDAGKFFEQEKTEKTEPRIVTDQHGFISVK